METIKIIGENLTTGTKKIIKEFNSFKDAAAYGRNLRKHLKETNKGYEESLGFTSICYVIGPNGNEYRYYYSF